MEGSKKEILNPFQRLVRNKSLLTRLAFVVVTFLFWLLIKLSRDGYSLRFEIPVEAYTESSKWMLVEQDRPSVEATITGPGFSLLRFSMFGVDPVLLELKDLPESGELSERRISWSTESYRMELAEKIGGEIKIEGIQPDTLHFVLSPRVKRRLPVKAVSKVNFQEPFRMRGEISLDPDSVTVWGPVSWMDTIQYIKTQLISKEDVNGDIDGSIAIQWVSRPEWEVDTMVVGYHIEAEAFSEGTLQVPIDVAFTPDQSMIRLFPKYVTITFNAPISVLKKIGPNDFEVTADIRKQKNNHLFLELSKVPKDVQVISWHPRKVDFLITPI